MSPFHFAFRFDRATVLVLVYLFGISLLVLFIVLLNRSWDRKKQERKKEMDTKKDDPCEKDEDYERDLLLAGTQFVVEANSCEVQMLWERYCKDTLYKLPYSIYEWRQNNVGYVVQVGRIADWPVNICLRWFWIDGVLILFYEPISQVVDHQMIEEWLKEHCQPRWDNGRRVAHTDAMNFHHVLDFIRDEHRR